MSNLKTKQLLINSGYYAGLHVYDSFYKIIFPNDKEKILVVKDDGTGFTINGKFVKCPPYAFRVYIIYNIISKCSSINYNFKLFCIFKDDKLLESNVLIDVLEYPKGFNKDKETALQNIFSESFLLDFPDKYKYDAVKSEVLEGYELLVKLFKGDET